MFLVANSQRSARLMDLKSNSCRGAINSSFTLAGDEAMLLGDKHQVVFIAFAATGKKMQKFLSALWPELSLF